METTDETVTQANIMSKFSIDNKSGRNHRNSEAKVFSLVCSKCILLFGKTLIDSGSPSFGKWSQLI